MRMRTDSHQAKYVNDGADLDLELVANRSSTRMDASCCSSRHSWIPAGSREAVVR